MKITPTLEAALRDLASWPRDYRYFWKPASMRRLAERGLTFKQDDGSYRLTATGMAWLAKNPL